MWKWCPQSVYIFSRASDHMHAKRKHTPFFTILVSIQAARPFATPLSHNLKQAPHAPVIDAQGGSTFSNADAGCSVGIRFPSFPLCINLLFQTCCRCGFDKVRKRCGFDYVVLINQNHIDSTARPYKYTQHHPPIPTHIHTQSSIFSTHAQSGILRAYFKRHYTFYR